MKWQMIPSLLAFAGAFIATLLLTPIVRELNRRLGMVDKPDPRRINTVPIPRGGGVAIFIAVFAVFAVLKIYFPTVQLPGRASGHFVRILMLSLLVTAFGYADDKFSLAPKVKLLGQIVIAALTWWWADLGFNDLWPQLPAWIDCILTILWIVGAVNAFNLIDGLDGLASGLAFVAAMGMAGGLFFMNLAGETTFYFAFAGGLLGFLRYNYNPASVFLGDSGSMMIGYMLAVLPLCSHVPDSFLVSVGVPLLAMGVPIFDTMLAIIRRLVRGAIVKEEGRDVSAGDSAKIMNADHDHIHHRILRAVGRNQRKAAFVLYSLALFLVAVGLVGMTIKTRAGGFWLAAVAIASVVAFRDMARVELFDAGFLLNRIAHTHDHASRTRRARLAVPLYVLVDLLALTGVFFFCCWVLGVPITARSVRVGLLVRVSSVFVGLVVFRTYVTVWSRALNSNYVRLFLACAFGAVAGSVIIYYLPWEYRRALLAFTVLYAVLSFIMLMVMRKMRALSRDIFYTVDCSRLVMRKDVSRILVYGAGLRYRTFRRELVRNTSANNRIIVGMLDDDIFLRNHYIGGLKVYGTLMDAPEIINRLNVDTVVITCDVREEWLSVIKKALAPTGVRVTQFTFTERNLS